MVQIKNSASNLSGALKQAAAALDTWRRMRMNDRDFSSSGANPDEPMSVVVIGTGGDLASTQKALKKQAGPWPAYVLLVEQGLLLGPDSPLREVLQYENDEATADFINFQNNVPLIQLRGNGSADGSGRLLMWLYFAILARTQRESSTKAFNALTRSVSHHFPVGFVNGTVVKRDPNPQPQIKP
jgi:hypothetical protein